MASQRQSWWSYAPDVFMGLALPVIAVLIARQMFAYLDPEAKAKQEAQQKKAAVESRLHSLFANHDPAEEEDDNDEEAYDDEFPGEKKQELSLNSYEQTIAAEVVAPAEIPVTFNDIGGLDQIIEELREGVIYPLTMPHLYSNHSNLLSAPSGVLLYGPPGCGKTMLAKALARESGACFINLHISTLTEKWYGDSNKLVAAVFSLARKLQPSIVFIDEIDAVLGQRRSGEHEASGMVKAEFMTHWDGLASSNADGGSQRICILGATNRIQDIDEAILRRMPKKFPVSLPNAAQRRQIFDLTLRDTKIDRRKFQNGAPAFDMDVLVRVSAGMSGSDIKEACRDAAMVPIREYIKEQRASGHSMNKRIKGDAVRGLQTDDFFGRRGGVPQMRLQEPEDDAAGHHSDSTEEVDEFDDPKEVCPGSGGKRDGAC